MVQAISDIKELVDDPSEENDLCTQPAQMVFSQIPNQSFPQSERRASSFKTKRDEFMTKLETYIEKIQADNEDDIEETDTEEFNKNYRKVQTFVGLTEEMNLKEKLCFKRALIMCRGLLK